MQYWPQYTLAILYALNIGIAAATHGKPREPQSVWSAIIGVAIGTTLLYFGGFWDHAFR